MELPGGGILSRRRMLSSQFRVPVTRVKWPVSVFLGVLIGVRETNTVHTRYHTFVRMENNRYICRRPAKVEQRNC